MTAILLVLNQLCFPLPWVKHSIDPSWEKGITTNVREFYEMVNLCGDCVIKCVQDEQCKACLDALQEIDTRDQVESYRAITSFESDLLRDFSFCILQKNNIFGCDAEIPDKPDVKPLATFHYGEPLTFEAASAILIGHLDESAGLVSVKPKRDVSWKVACGANVAYDQFSDQNQLFYPGKGKTTDLWYDPVFKVKTLDGRSVWAKRHYKVRRGEVPGES